MLTMCPNEECQQKYRIKKEHIGKRTRCKKCQLIFEIVAIKKPIDLPQEESEDNTDSPEQSGKKRSSKKVMEEQILKIQDVIDTIIPELLRAYKRNDNESDTRMLIDKILQEALGYNFEDIKTEARIEGRKADYLLSIKGDGVLVGEVKKIGMPLNEKHLYQTSSYGAHSGIQWIFLTNGLVWQLYRIMIDESIDTQLVFTVDLKDGLDDEEAKFMYYISKWGMSRKNLLKKEWKKISALSYDNIVSAIVSDDVISKIRIAIKKKGSNLKDEEVRAAVEAHLFQLG